MVVKKSGVSKRIKAAPYNRGGFWLEKRKNSDSWYVFWYNREKRQYEYKSSRTDDFFDAHNFLNRHYLEFTNQADAFCGYCGQKIADGAAYGLLQAIDDYMLEIGENRVSEEAIRSRLSHIERYVETKLARPDLSCAESVNDRFADGFRDWLQPQQVVWKNGKGIVTKSSPRTRSSVEESVHQLRAVLYHAVRKGRSDAKPTFKALSRQVVTAPIRSRADINLLAEMVEYAAEYDKRSSLHRFLVVSLCTAARPDSIFDMNVDPNRYQWEKEQDFFNLNPHGRRQTKKYRPLIPVVPLLKSILLEAEKASPEGWVVHYFGSRVLNVRSAWRTMVKDLGLPGGREWGSYLMRRSVATLLRDSGANAWDVMGLLGHRIAGTTEIYAYSRLATTAREGIENILADIEKIAPGALQGKRRAEG